MECKVFGAERVEIVTKTRTEHMTRDDKLKARANKNPLLSFFGPPEPELEADAPPAGEEQVPIVKTTFEHYINSKSRSESGLKVPEECSKAQKFKAHLWLCEKYPLSLQEQVMPIVDLLAISNTHFQKLKHFIQMQLPSGFPVKIEIPLFHVINARITFSNIQALDSPVVGVTSFREEGGHSSAAIDDSVFEVPRSYDVLGGASENTMRQYQGTDEEEILLQYAIRQSLGEQEGTNGESGEHVDIWEALEGLPPGQSRANFHGEDRMLQQAIEASMLEARGQVGGSDDRREVTVDRDAAVDRREADGEDELAVALRLSQEQEVERQERIRKEEEEMIRQVMELSLREK